MNTRELYKRMNANSSPNAKRVEELSRQRLYGGGQFDTQAIYELYNLQVSGKPSVYPDTNQESNDE
jgi:hypothetical protein